MLYKNIMLNKFKSTRNLHEINFQHDLHENTQENSTSSNEDDQPPDCQESHPDQDLQPPMDDLLDFINSQHHSDDQLDQVLQTYQTYTESQSPTRQVNAHITYHVANQAMHQWGANGGLAGSDVRVLNTSSRQCTVIGINNHEIPGLDIVQCAALISTNYGLFYAYYGKGHSIHSSGQIEWHTNIVDDKSVQVGGQQRIVTIHGYSLPYTHFFWPLYKIYSVLSNHIILCSCMCHPKLCFGLMTPPSHLIHLLPPGSLFLSLVFVLQITGELMMTMMM